MEEATLCATCTELFPRSECEAYFQGSECRPCRTKGNRYLHKIKANLWEGNRALAELWDAEANAPLLPEDVAVQSNTRFTFLCACGNVMLVSPNNKWSAKSISCDPCGKKSMGAKNARPKGKTVADVDFLIKQWDFEANEVEPKEVSFRSNKVFFWKCELGHSVLSSVCNKYKGNGCFVCAEELFESTGERELRAFVETIVDEAVRVKTKSHSFPYELDVLLEKSGKAIEYNGDYWHSNELISKKKGISNVEYHQRKIDKAAAKGVEVAFVWDEDWKIDRDAVESDLEAWLTDRMPLASLPRLTRLTSTRDR